MTISSPSPLTKVAAVLVLCALAVVAAYSLSAGPTVVTVRGGSPQTQTITVPQGEQEQGSEGD